MKIYEYNGIVPVISKDAFIHDTAVVIGDVFIEEGVYVGPNASIRGDFGRIIIQKNANIQDCCVLHGYPKIDTIVEENGHIGHGAVLHSCHVKYNAMVGMSTVVMDEAVIGKNSIVGASSLVPAKMQIPDNSLAFGSPARVKRELSNQEIEWKKENSKSYTDLAYSCIESLKPCEPLRKSNKTRDEMKCILDYEPKKN